MLKAKKRNLNFYTKIIKENTESVTYQEGSSINTSSSIQYRKGRNEKGNNMQKETRLEYVFLLK